MRKIEKRTKESEKKCALKEVNIQGVTSVKLEAASSLVCLRWGKSAIKGVLTYTDVY